MIEKTITYENFVGETCETKAQFHLFEQELATMELDTESGLAKYLEKIAGENDSRELYKIFRTLILASYGELATDNSTFVKKKNGVPLSEMFEQHAAFNALIMSFFDKTDDLVEFIIGILPKNLQAQARKATTERAAQ